MAAPFSNAVVNITLQEQDLISPGLPIPITRTAPTMLIPASTQLAYSGFITVTSTNFTIATGTVTNPVLFLFVRNTQSTLLTLTVTPATQAASTMILPLNAIYMWGNPSNPNGALNVGTGLTNAVMSTNAGTTTIVEVMFAF